MPTRDNLLLYLKKNKNLWVSGEILSNHLAVSRAAINKHISKLREDGYVIESATRKGYLFTGYGDILLTDEIRDGLDTEIFGKQEIVCLKETDSTNLQAKILAAGGAPEGTLVLAEERSAGRGRKGRTWFSAKGRGIYASLILRPVLSPSEAQGITLITAVAAAESLISATKLPIRIKWPNDLLINGKKIAGILTEIGTEMDSIDYIVVGIGLNVNTPLKDFPEDISEIATSIFIESGQLFSRTKIIQDFLKCYEKYYEIFKKSGFAGARDKWMALSNIIGKQIMVKDIGKEYSGRVIDIDNDGVLILEDEKGNICRVISGDLVLPDK